MGGSVKFEDALAARLNIMGLSQQKLDEFIAVHPAQLTKGAPAGNPSHPSDILVALTPSTCCLPRCSEMTTIPAGRPCGAETLKPVTTMGTQLCLLLSDSNSSNGVGAVLTYLYLSFQHKPNSLTKSTTPS